MSIELVVYLAAVGLGIGLLIWRLGRSAERPGTDGEMFGPNDPSDGYVPPADTPGHGHM